jgi:hypothetical protein
MQIVDVEDGVMAPSGTNKKVTASLLAKELAKQPLEPGIVISGSSSGNAVLITQTGTGNALVVEDSTSPDDSPFVVDASGIIVHGTTSSLPVSVTTEYEQLHGTSAGAASRSGAAWSAASASTAPTYTFARSRGGSVGDYTTVNAGDTVGLIQFRAADGSQMVSSASIVVQVDGTPSTNDMPGRLEFSTTADGASTPTERMRISQDGVISMRNDSGLQIARTSVTSPATEDGNVFSGSYTPTITNGTNISSSTSTVNRYARVGNQVTVHGTVAFTFTSANVNSNARISLPIPSSFSSVTQARLTGTSYTLSNRDVMSGVASISTNDISIRCYPTSADDVSFQYIMMYEIV